MIENRQLITSAIAEKMTKKAKSVLEPQKYGEAQETGEDNEGGSESDDSPQRTQPRRVMFRRAASIECVMISPKYPVVAQFNPFVGLQSPQGATEALHGLHSVKMMMMMMMMTMTTTMMKRRRRAFLIPPSRHLRHVQQFDSARRPTGM